MKSLYLFRHAKAIKLTIGTADIERELRPKGNKDAHKMARRLRMLGHVPDLIIASPANRAVETAHILANEFEYPLQKIVLEPLLYSDNEKKVLNMLKAIDDKYDSVMLVGHNPMLEEFAAFFLGNYEIRLSTAGCCCVEFNKSSWKKITKAQGKLNFCDFPKNKAPKDFLSRQVSENLTEILNTDLENELKEIDASAYKATEEIIHSSVRKVVKKFVKSLKFEKLANFMKNNIAEKQPRAESESSMNSEDNISQETIPAKPDTSLQTQGAKNQSKEDSIS